MKTVTFPRWPTWNFQFPEIDVERITAVRYVDKATGAQETLPRENVRLAIGHNGISSIVFKEPHNLPETAAGPEAVTVEYEV